MNAVTVTPGVVLIGRGFMLMLCAHAPQGSMKIQLGKDQLPRLVDQANAVEKAGAHESVPPELMTPGVS